MAYQLYYRTDDGKSVESFDTLDEANDRLKALGTVWVEESAFFYAEVIGPDGTLIQSVSVTQ